MTTSTRLAVVFSTVVTLSLALMTSFGRASQDGERVVDKQAFANEPVKIRAIKTKKNGVIKEIGAGKKFNDTDDWLRGLTVNVENISGKSINFVSVLIVYARDKADETSNGAPFGDFISYGVSPFKPSSAPAQMQVIPAGGSVELTLSESAYDENNIALKNLKYKKSVRRIELTVDEVGFEDGTAWSKGQYWRPDPSNPGRWLPLEQNCREVATGESFSSQSFVQSAGQSSGAGL